MPNKRGQQRREAAEQPAQANSRSTGIEDLVDIDQFLDNQLLHLGNGPAAQLMQHNLGDAQLLMQQPGAMDASAAALAGLTFPYSHAGAAPAPLVPPTFGLPERMPERRPGAPRADGRAQPQPQPTRQSSRRAAAKKQRASEDEEEEEEEASSDEERQPARKRGESAPSESERRHQALQEKNRRAQRRFRERQKSKISELHQQIELLTSKVGQLQTENGSLKNRTGILQKILDMRNETIQGMQEERELPGEELPGQGLGLPFPPEVADAASGSSYGGRLVHLTPEMLRDLNSEQMQGIYGTYVKALAQVLALLQPAAPAGAMEAGERCRLEGEMQELVRDLVMLLYRFIMAKPLDSRKFVIHSRAQVAASLSDDEVIALWRRVLGRIPPLRPEQAAGILALRSGFYLSIEPIMEERRQLNAQLQADLPRDTFHTRSALTYIKAHEAVARLRANLKQEHNTMLTFATAVLKGSLDTLQLAALLVESYPAVPDALGVASAVAAEHPGAAAGMPPLAVQAAPSGGPPLPPVAPRPIISAAAMLATGGMAASAPLAMGLLPAGMLPAGMLPADALHTHGGGGQPAAGNMASTNGAPAAAAQLTGNDYCI